MFHVYAVDFVTGRRQNFIQGDSFETLREAIDDFSSAGWEDLENVVHQAVIIQSPERIEAVGHYVMSAKNDLPVLVWHFADSTIEQRYYEREYSRFN